MTSTGSGGSNHRTTSNETLRNYEQDTETLIRRISDLNGTGPEQTPSPFVSGLRTSVEGNRAGDVDDTKIQLQTVENMLSRLVELDRLVLKKTEMTFKARSRRGSRGADLVTIPTHLLLVDRLMDLYALSQRTTGTQDMTASPEVPPPDNNELNLHLAEIARLSKTLAESEAAKIKLQDSVDKKVAEIESIKSQHLKQQQQARVSSCAPQRSPRDNLSPRSGRSLTVVGSGSNVPAPDPNVARLEKENAELKARVALTEQHRRCLEEKCEMAAAAHHSSLAAVNALTDRFKQKGASVDFVPLAGGAVTGVVSVHCV